jgi:hypothetical protein
VIVLNDWHLKRMMNEYFSSSHEARAYQLDKKLPGGARRRRIQIEDVRLCRWQSSATSTIATTTVPEPPSRLIQTKLGRSVSDLICAAGDWGTDNSITQSNYLEMMQM